ncbi:MAG TPA: hypothetical protein VFA66_06875 [Gaiellaceae bacterium]|nr:hypothetical protein [Gaiellaceae bacterium]
MLTHVRRRTILVAALGGALLATLGVTVARSQAAAARELPVSPSWEQGNFAHLAPGSTYRAGLVSPTPTVTPTDAGWSGSQVVTHLSGKVRYESTVFIGRHGVITLTSGPAMTLTPAAAIAAPLSRIASWNFAPYDRPTPVRHWRIAGRPALYFDATTPPPGGWSLVGSNPPEVRIEHDLSFRMAALSVRGKTVVIVIQAPVADFAAFLPGAVRLLASLRFPAS